MALQDLVLRVLVVVTVLWAAQVIKDGYKDNGWMAGGCKSLASTQIPEIMGEFGIPHQTYPDQKYRAYLIRLSFLKTTNNQWFCFSSRNLALYDL